MKLTYELIVFMFVCDGNTPVQTFSVEDEDVMLNIILRNDDGTHNIFHEINAQSIGLPLNCIERESVVYKIHEIMSNMENTIEDAREKQMYLNNLILQNYPELNAEVLAAVDRVKDLYKFEVTE